MYLLTQCTLKRICITGCFLRRVTDCWRFDGELFASWADQVWVRFEMSNIFTNWSVNSFRNWFGYCYSAGSWFCRRTCFFNDVNTCNYMGTEKKTKSIKIIYLWFCNLFRSVIMIMKKIDYSVLQYGVKNPQLPCPDSNSWYRSFETLCQSKNSCYKLQYC